jgi:hypothetical protein
MTVIERDQIIGYLLAVPTNAREFAIDIIRCNKNTAGHQMCGAYCQSLRYRTGHCKKSGDHHICVCTN